MKRQTRIFAFLLSMILVVLSFQLPAMGAEDITQDAPTTTTTQSAPASSTLTESDGLPLGKGEKTTEELQAMTLDPATVPEVLSLASAQQKGHVNRLKEQETSLSTVTFQNKNGTKTTYIFNSPVKYIDEQGNVQDKSTALTLQSNGYAMLNNSVKAYFSQKQRTAFG